MIWRAPIGSNYGMASETSTDTALDPHPPTPTSLQTAYGPPTLTMQREKFAWTDSIYWDLYTRFTSASPRDCKSMIIEMKRGNTLQTNSMQCNSYDLIRNDATFYL